MYSMYGYNGCVGYIESVLLILFHSGETDQFFYLLVKVFSLSRSKRVILAA